MDRIYIFGADTAFNNIGWNYSEIIKSELKIINAGVIENPKQDTVKSKVINDFLDAKEIAYTLKTHIESFLRNLPFHFVWEIPVGSKSSRANRLLGMTTGIVAATVSDIEIHHPDVFFSHTVMPSAVKKKAGNKKNTSKEEIMDKVITKYGTLKNGKYKIGKLSFGKGKFEHVADSIILSEIIAEELNAHNST